MPVMEAKRKSKVKAAEWIDWYPGPPISPLPDDTVVDVELRNGMILKDVSAGAISWGSTGKYDGDVVRYRIVETSSRDPNWMPHDCRNHPRPPDYAMVRGKYRCGMLSDPYAAAKFEWGVREDCSDYEIISYVIVDPAIEIPWFPTEKSQCPLPGARVRIRLRSAATVNDSPGSPGTVAEGWSWSGGHKAQGEIVAYVVTAPPPTGMSPHSPKRDSENPARLLSSRVRVRTRSGDEASVPARLVNWKHIIRNRDQEIVAWRQL
jgi:hypothetical protein